MAKTFFLLVFVVCLMVIVGMVASGLGLMPQSAYPLIFKIESALPFLPQPAPYLEKFQGHWAITITPDPSSESTSVCQPAQGTLSVTNGDLSGTVTITGEFVALRATIGADGTFSGVMGAGSQATQGTLRGTIAGGVGGGSWQDIALGCSGQLALTKLEPIVDPTAGRTVSITGVMTIQRGSESSSGIMGENIYPGDILSAPAGSSALLEVGQSGAAVTLLGGTSYTVPNVTAY